jgi:YggT family protein
MMILFYAIRIYEVILIIRIFMSWMRPDPYHPFVQWIYRLTDPVLDPIRRMLPLNFGGFDFSPIIVFLLLGLLKGALFGGAFL